LAGDLWRSFAMDAEEALRQALELLKAACHSKDMKVMSTNIALAHDLTLSALAAVKASRLQKS
jgi:plasmid maintenance system killer protein